MIYVKTEELYHHGILGQRWGKKNGPPYPLGVSDHSTSEKEAGWRKSLKREDNKYSKVLDRMSKLSRETEKKIKKKAKEKFKSDTVDKIDEFLHSDSFKTGLKIAAAAVAIYGATKIGEKFLVDYYIDVNRDLYESLPPPDFKNIGLDKIVKAKTNYYDNFFNSDDPDAWEDLLDGVNHDVNVENFYDNPGRNENCTFCSAAIIMRLKGYETTASRCEGGFTTAIVSEWYEGSKFKTPKCSNTGKLYKHLLKQGDGSYGTLHVNFKAGGSHSIVYVVRNGKVEILDGQINTSYGDNPKDLRRNLFNKCNVSATEVCNLTNCEPTDYILRAVYDDGISTGTTNEVFGGSEDPSSLFRKVASNWN